MSKKGEWGMLSIDTSCLKPGMTIITSGALGEGKFTVESVDSESSITVSPGIDVHHNGVPLHFSCYDCDKDGFLVFTDPSWIGRKLVISAENEDAVEVVVGSDYRAPVPWWSTEARLTYEHG